jgi:hypothetical protein
LDLGEPRATSHRSPATSVAPYLGRARTPRRRSDQWSEACAAAIVPLGPVTRAWRLRPVPRGHSTLAPARAAFRHWPSAGRTSPIVSAPCRHHCSPRRCEQPPRRAPGAIKLPSFTPSRARAHRCRLPLASLVISLLRSRPRQTRDPQLFPTTRSSPKRM